MLFWFLDRALMLTALFALAAIGFGLLYRNNRDRNSLIGLGVTVTLAALLWLLTLFVVTDRQQIERNLKDMADAVVNRKPEQLKKHLAAEVVLNQGDRLDREAVVAAAVRQGEGLRVSGIRLRQFHFESVSRGEAKAVVTFAAIVDLQESTYPFLCRTEFAHQRGAWLLRSIEVESRVGNQPIRIRIH